MDHQNIIEFLPAYLDQELGIPDLIAVEQHLGGCPSCQSELSELRNVRAQLKKHAPYFKASGQLARRIATKIEKEDSHALRSKAWHLNWMNSGAVMATLLALAWSSALFIAQPSAREKLMQEVVSSHVRSLQVDHLSDVVSSDRHKVKPWFNGKLDFSPPVFDLSSSGFPLTGGRLDYLDNRTVAVLIYRRNLHPINLYIWPNMHGDAAQNEFERQGYHLIRWSVGGMEYWAVSDLATSELESFVSTLRSQV